MSSSDERNLERLPGEAVSFPTTLWSEVRRAGSGETDELDAALERLLRNYRHPLLTHILRHFGTTPEQAEDWLHSFVLQKVMRKRILAVASRQRGRFRTFLLNSLDRFIISEQRKAKARFRRPEQGVVSFEELPADELERVTEGTSDQLTGDWARAVLSQALARMKARCCAEGHEARWTVFERRLLAPHLEGVPPLPYEQMVREYGLRSPAEAAQALYQAKDLFRAVLREVVAESVAEPGEVDLELAEFRAALRRE